MEIEYWDEVSDLVATMRIECTHAANLNAHPDCRDPEHPGCERCKDQEQPEEEGRHFFV